MRRSDATCDLVPSDTYVPDRLFGGSLPIQQPQRGYRVNVDTLLLADAVRRARPRRIDHLIDLGAGVGGLALSIQHLGPVGRIDLIENEASVASMARHNLRSAGCSGEVFELTLGRDPLPASLARSADVVVCNPPFFEPDTTRPRADSIEQAARSGRLEPFVTAAASCMGRRSAAFFVYPASVIEEFFATTRRAGLHAKRLRFVHAYASKAARVALVELRRAKPGGLVVEPPLVEWDSRGVRSDEVVRLTERRATDQK